jgi:hypothetical protein
VKGSDIQKKRQGDRYCYLVPAVYKEQRISSPKHDALCSLMKYMTQGHHDFYSLLYAATLQRTLEGGKAVKAKHPIESEFEQCSVSDMK